MYLFFLLLSMCFINICLKNMTVIQWKIELRTFSVFKIDQVRLLGSAASRGHHDALSKSSSQSERKIFWHALIFLRQVMLPQSGVLFDPLYFTISSSVVSKKTKYHGAFTVVEEGYISAALNACTLNIFVSRHECIHVLVYFHQWEHGSDEERYISSRFGLQLDVCLHRVYVEGRRSQNFTATFCEFTPAEIFS